MSETRHLEGDLYIETFTNNVSNGVIGPVDVESLEVKPDSQKISITSKRKGSYGQSRENYHIPKLAMVTINKTSHTQRTELMPILPPLPRPQRRHIHLIIHTTRDMTKSMPAV